MIKLCLHIALIRFLTYLAGQVLGDPAAWNREDPGSPWQPASLPCFGVQMPLVCVFTAPNRSIPTKLSHRLAQGAAPRFAGGGPVAGHDGRVGRSRGSAALRGHRRWPMRCHQNQVA